MQQLFILISNPKELRTILSVDVLDYTSSANWEFTQKPKTIYRFHLEFSLLVRFIKIKMSWDKEHGFNICHSVINA